MNIIDKWFRKMIKKVEQEDCLVTSVSGSSYSGLRSGQLMHFTIYKATGGFVIQYYSEDKTAHSSYSVGHTSTHEPKLLIVHHGEDLGKAIDQLIVVEALKA